MRFVNRLIIIVLLASYVAAPPAGAETRYVVDELVITLRAGKSTGHKIIKTLKTGTPLEILEDDDATYLKVRTADGIEGYVLKQYVSANPPKTLRLKELEVLNSTLQKKIETLEQERNSLEAELEKVREEYRQDTSLLSTKAADLEQSLEQAVANEQTTSEKYEILRSQAENVIEITTERDQLLQQNQKLEADLNELLQKNESLADGRMVKWFLAGAGVFFFGWIIGKISRKKRSRL